MPCRVRIDLQKITINDDNEILGDEFVLEAKSYPGGSIKVPVSVPGSVIYPYPVTVNHNLYDEVIEDENVYISLSSYVTEVDPAFDDETDGNVTFERIPCQNPLTFRVIRRVIDKAQDLDATFHYLIRIEPQPIVFPPIIIIRRLKKIIKSICG